MGKVNWEQFSGAIGLGLLLGNILTDAWRYLIYWAFF